MLKENRRLIEAGGAIVVLRKNDKRPVDSKWTELARWTWDEAEQRFPEGANIGLRLGAPSRIGKLYSVGVDLDITSTEPRHIKEARAALYELLPEFDSLAVVISGSGGESRHGHGLSDEPVRSKTVRQSPDFVIDRFGKKKRAWQIEIGGTGKQFVLPPSIHPDTRKPYRWLDGKEPDWRELPLISAARIRSWSKPDAPKSDREVAADMDELSAWYKNQPRHFSLDEISDILDTLAAHGTTRREFIEDRDGWFRIGMALHHQFEGGEEGYERWCVFSGESDKFDEEDQWRVWKSFGKRQSGVPLTLATLKREAEGAKIAVETGGERPEEPEIETDFVAPEHVEIDDPDVEVDEDSGNNPKAYDTDFHKRLRVMAREMEDDHEREWRRELDRNQDGKIKNNVHNVALIVADDYRLQGWLGFNEFTGESVQRQPLKRQGSTMMKLEQRDPIGGDILSKEHEHNLRLSWPYRQRERTPDTACFRPTET